MTDDVEGVGGVADDLTPRERLFCEAFGNPESRTFARAGMSAKAVGYASPRDSGWRLRRAAAGQDAGLDAGRRASLKGIAGTGKSGVAPDRLGLDSMALGKHRRRFQVDFLPT